MAKHDQLTWDPSRKQWKATHNGKTYHVPLDDVDPSNEEGYLTALEIWRERLLGLEAIEREAQSCGTATAERRYQRSLIRLRVQIELNIVRQGELMAMLCRELDRGSPTSAA